MIKKFLIISLILFLMGCAAHSPYDRSYVSKSIVERTNYELGKAAEPGELNIPGGISLSDGLTQEEAVAIALWNNAQFQADLTALGFSRADLIEASLFTNPVFSIFFPVGPKLLEEKLNFPFDILWQRPRRISSAKLDAERISKNLVQNGLALIRDVQVVYADNLLSQEQTQLAKENMRLRAQMSEIAQARLRAGDISELEATAARVDSLIAEDSVERFATELNVLRNKLNVLLGFGTIDRTFEMIPPPIVSSPVAPMNELLEIAFAARPDLRAAEIAIEAAGKRVGWERSKIFNFIGIIDAKDKGEEHLTVGPGFQIEIPIFNWNSGNVARAKAMLEQSAQQYVAVRHSIILEVREAYNRYVSACKAFELWDTGIVPSLEEAIGRAQKAYAVGEVSYLFVLETMRQLLDARLRKAEVAAELRRTAAQLNYSVGKNTI